MRLHDGADRGPTSARWCECLDVVLLTRGGCVTTGTMRARLDDALRAMGSTLEYEVLDLDAVPESDLRRGYPTPTLLYGNRDVFDLPVPQPPFPEPT